MDRSRPKRYYYDQDYDSENIHPRNRPRYANNSYGGGYNYHHRRSAVHGGGGGGGGGGRKVPDTTLMVTTSYRILCHDVKAGGVIGKSGSIIKAIRQHTGAWINVHELIPGDEERIIEISDTRRRDPEGRMPAFSPAQEALLLIHERILETEMNDGGFGGNVYGEDEGEDYRGSNRVVTRMVVSRMHVGCLLGKGGKIIEQMRMETKTHIRILPRDQTLPRCVAMSEEIVQVVGEMNCVKHAIEIISSRLRESQHRDRSQYNKQDRLFPDEDNLYANNTPRRSSTEGPIPARYSVGSRSNGYPSRLSRRTIESEPTPTAEYPQSFPADELVFRILCPIEKVESVIGEHDSIIELLQKEIGVNVEVSDPVEGSNEHVIIISSDEGPDDELFPAQEALLHIQTCIVDLLPEKDNNIIITRLLLQSDEVGSLRHLGKISGANIEILPRQKLPVGIAGTDEIVQIVGEIKAAREALMEVTSRIRSFIYQDFNEKDAPSPRVSSQSPEEGALEPEMTSRNNVNTTLETQGGNPPVVSTPNSPLAVATTKKAKDLVPQSAEVAKQHESERREDQPSGLSRMSLVTRSTLEVVVPPLAASLVAKPKKLNLISELSGATVKVIDDRPEVSEKIIQISGTPEQAEKAQSLLQGYILSTEEDGL